MKTPERRALISRLIQTMRDEGSWAGETHIQKSVLFLQDLLQVPIGYQFVLYLHGPFSFELRKELNHMRAGLMLDMESNPGYGPSFTLGRWGKPAAERFKEYEGAIRFVSRMSRNDARTLERLSTAFFLQNKYPEQSDVQIAHWINKLKPHITVALAFDAIREVKEIRRNAKNIQTSSI